MEMVGNSIGFGLVRGQRQRRQHGRECKAVVETTFGGQRVADVFGDAFVVEQRVDERDLGGSDDRCQAHRFPQRHDGQNQKCGQRAEAEGQRNSMTRSRNVTSPRRTTAVRSSSAA